MLLKSFNLLLSLPSSEFSGALCRDPQGLSQGRPEDQGDAVRLGREQEEHGQDDGAGREAAGEDQDVSEARKPRYLILSSSLAVSAFPT